MNHNFYSLKYLKLQLNNKYTAYRSTVTSRLFTHIVSTEKMRKDTRDRKDTRGTKCTYCNGCFLILLLLKSRLWTFPLLTICLLFVYLYI